MKGLQQKIEKYFILGLGYFTFGWCILALSIQLFFLTLHFSDNDELAGKIANEIEVRIDGRFTNDPRNFWYKK